MKKINVLITGAGAPGIAGTIKCLRENPDYQTFLIHSCDIDSNPVGKYLSDFFVQVPPPENEKYIPFLLNYVKENGIDLIIPQTTREIEVLSEHKEKFSPTPILVSDFQSIKNASDKYNLLVNCKELNIPFPEFFLVNNKVDLKNAIEKLGYPEKKVIVKPRLSNGMRGVRIIQELPLSMEKYFNEKPSGLEISLDNFMSIFPDKTFPELLVTEYMPGTEYSVDVLRGPEKNIVIPRERLKIRSGISFETISDLENVKIIEYSDKLAKHLNLKHCFGFQFKLDENGIPKILECNPRIQGTMEASAHAGCNMIYYATMLALKEINKLPTFNFIHKKTFKRFWGGIAIN